MKNEEIIEILKGKLEYYNSSLAEYYDEELINALEEANKKIKENTKLKAEIEQLKTYATELINARNLSEETAITIQEKMRRELILQRENERLKEQNKHYFKQYAAAIDEIERLESELEQSVIKCTHGYDKRQNEIGETLIFCEHTDNWMNVTLGECVGNCEAEQSLKGQV